MHVGGRCGKQSADEEVDDADEKRRANPDLTTRRIHVRRQLQLGTPRNRERLERAAKFTREKENACIEEQERRRRQESQIYNLQYRDRDWGEGRNSK
jgi:hypothetical protein